MKKNAGGPAVSSTRLLEQVRAVLKDMTNDERLEFFAKLTDLYCRHCGRDHSDSLRRCQCWNDE